MRIIVFILCAVLLVFIILFLILFIWSPGKIDQYLDKDGQVLTESIAEICRKDIGGVTQGMIIKGKDERNPVLLFLHGGPGNPEYVLAKEAAVGLEDAFTVCWWEQRGSGMSYSKHLSKDSMTIEQFIQDTVEITNYLRERFDQDKIYLMGHSWGTFLGMATVSQYPELYSAYIGIGQISNQMESERLAYSLMISEADNKTREKLEAHSLDALSDITPEYLMLRSNALNSLGYGVYHKPQSKTEMLLPIFKAPEYTISDIYGYAMGSLFSLDCPINDTCYSTNLMQDIPIVNIPVFLFHGTYDRQVSFELAEKYFQILQAPQKEFYAFEQSAHSPFLEEPELFMQIIKEEVLQSKKHSEG